MRRSWPGRPDMPRASTSYAEASLVEATIDAQRQVSIWQSQRRLYRERTMRHVARAFGCYPSWAAIQEAIVRLEMGEVETYRLAA
jgi:hypothetical protein